MRSARLKRNEQIQKTIFGGAGFVCALGILVGLGKLRSDIQRWREDQARSRAPWERL